MSQLLLRWGQHPKVRVRGDGVPDYMRPAFGAKSVLVPALVLETYHDWVAVKELKSSYHNGYM